MAVLIIALAITAKAETIHFDRIDVNHVHNARDGSHSFDQLIFWRRSKERPAEFISCGFKIIHDGRDKDGKWIGSELHPRRLRDGRYAVTIKRGHRRVRVTCDFVIEHWSLGDPERADLAARPELRREWK